MEDSMPTDAVEGPEHAIPERLTWDELQRLPDEVAGGIELWDGRVVRARRGPFEHQQFSVRMRNALETCARRAMSGPATGGNGQCWQVGVETNVFFAPDKSSFLTPDFLVRHCLERGSDTFAADVALVGEVLSGSDTPKRRNWKMDRYAEAGIPWYWEVELDSAKTWDITWVRAYELAPIQADGLKVKPLRPAVYVPVGEWEPGDAGVVFPEPFKIHISWEELAF
ncbi:Uma2 family endonuclease [Streptomyces sp. NPDC048484]|uniref:Uma2 family endonuclease n=1 Tax=Streptomyces sp. NPDC048484 TaxID=3155146 RepID=UPI00342FCF4D